MPPACIRTTTLILLVLIVTYNLLHHHCHQYPHPPLPVQNRVDAFEASFADHKYAKLAAHETFFRAVEAQEHIFFSAVRALGG